MGVWFLIHLIWELVRQSMKENGEWECVKYRKGSGVLKPFCMVWMKLLIILIRGKVWGYTRKDILSLGVCGDRASPFKNLSPKNVKGMSHIYKHLEQVLWNQVIQQNVDTCPFRTSCLGCGVVCPPTGLASRGRIKLSPFAANPMSFWTTRSPSIPIWARSSL